MMEVWGHCAASPIAAAKRGGVESMMGGWPLCKPGQLHRGSRLEAANEGGLIACGCAHVGENTVASIMKATSKNDGKTAGKMCQQTLDNVMNECMIEEAIYAD